MIEHVLSPRRLRGGRGLNTCNVVLSRNRPAIKTYASVKTVLIEPRKNPKIFCLWLDISTFECCLFAPIEVRCQRGRTP
jgi:hypothetical protein